MSTVFKCQGTKCVGIFHIIQKSDFEKLIKDIQYIDPKVKSDGSNLWIEEYGGQRVSPTNFGDGIRGAVTYIRRDDLPDILSEVKDYSQVDDVKLLREIIDNRITTGKITSFVLIDFLVMNKFDVSCDEEEYPEDFKYYKKIDADVKEFNRLYDCDPPLSSFNREELWKNQKVDPVTFTIKKL
jgi:hypothetical protein